MALPTTTLQKTSVYAGPERAWYAAFILGLLSALPSLT